MANSNGWGDGSVNNNIGWGQGANNTIGWGKSQLDSWSGATDIDGGNLPSNSVAPAITGTAQEGQTLTCSTGTWSGSPTYTYQWKRNGNNIGGATNSTYLLVLADVGQSIKCTVTATNFVGSATADSNTVTPTSSVDADAQAFITAASITDPTQQSAINTLVVDLKGYGVWTKMKALYPFVGGTAAQHKWNLKDPRDLDAAFRLVFYGGGTHSVNGYQPNGINGSADTFLNPSITLGLNNSGMSFYSRENKITACLMGSGGGGGVSILMIPDFGNNFDYSSVYGDGFRTPVQSDKRGLFTISRISSANEQGYRNGVQYYNNNFTSIARPNASILIGARNLSGQYSNVQCAFSAIHDGLTSTEAANFYTAVQAFQTALGRSIGTQTVSDADAQAFVTNAGIVDQVEANAVNNLVIGLKADGLWTKMKALYPMVGGTSTSNSYNLRNTAQFQITWSGGVTHSSTGAKFGGVNGFGNTNLNGLSALNQDSTHLSFYSRTQSNGTEVEIGAAAPSNGSLIEIRTAGTTYFRVNSAASYLTYSDADSRAFYLANRTASNVVNGWRNSTKVATGTTASSSLYNFNLFLGALNENGNAIYYTTKECAFASIGDGLTDTEATNLNSRVTTFQTALNRNV